MFYVWGLPVSRDLFRLQRVLQCRENGLFTQKVTCSVLPVEFSTRVWNTEQHTKQKECYQNLKEGSFFIAGRAEGQGTGARCIFSGRWMWKMYKNKDTASGKVTGMKWLLTVSLPRLFWTVINTHLCPECYFFYKYFLVIKWSPNIYNICKKMCINKEKAKPICPCPCMNWNYKKMFQHEEKTVWKYVFLCWKWVIFL